MIRLVLRQILSIMIKDNNTLTVVLLSTMLFFTFSMVHEFDWLLPPSPVATTAVSSGIAEEIGCEDEIEHEIGYVILSFSNERDIDLSPPVKRLFIARVLTPPPDIS